LSRSIENAADVRRRVVDAPLWAHAATLVVLLVVLLPVVGTSASFTADEGAYIFEAKTIARSGSFLIDHPLPEADPEGTAFPLALARETDGGWVTVGKHPVYSVLLATADRVGGVTAMVVLSLLGTVGAAVAAALIARRFDPSLALPAFWFVGVGSPLFFDGYWVMAHTLAAAACGLSFLTVLHARERESTGLMMLAGGFAAVGVLLRREAVLFVGALVLVLLVRSLTNRRRLDAITGFVVGGCAGVALAFERVWSGVIVPGTSSTPRAPVASSGSLSGRLDGFVITWLQPGYAPLEGRHMFLIVMAALGATLVCFARWRPREGGLLAVAAVAVVGVAVAAVVSWAPGPVPGLLVACPVVLYGLVAFRRVPGEPAIALWTAAVFAAIVLATQYDRGGALEWGGRYFALALPVAIPALLLGLRATITALDRTGRIAIVGALVVSSVTMSWLAIEALRDGHQRHDRLVSAAAELGLTTPPGDGGSAVIVAADFDLGRFAWPVADETRWLYASDLDALAPRLRSAGIEQFVYVADDRDGSEARSAGLVVTSTVAGGAIQQLAFPTG